MSYGYQNLEYETWILTDQWSSAKQSLAVIDTQIEQDLYDLPLRITAAAEAILDSVSDTNHDYGSIVGLLVLGRIIRIFGGTQGGKLNQLIHERSNSVVLSYSRPEHHPGQCGGSSVHHHQLCCQQSQQAEEARPGGGL